MIRDVGFVVIDVPSSICRPTVPFPGAGGQPRSRQRRRPSRVRLSSSWRTKYASSVILHVHSSVVVIPTGYQHHRRRASLTLLLQTVRLMRCTPHAHDFTAISPPGPVGHTHTANTFEHEYALKHSYNWDNVQSVNTA